MSKLIILVGKSGAGKSTTEKKLVEAGLVKPIHIFTTRESRPDDPYWIHHIKDGEDMENSDEYRLIHTLEVKYKKQDIRKYYYAIKDDDFEEDLIVSFLSIKDAKRFKRVIEQIRYIDTIIFEITATDEEIKKVYKDRGFSEDVIQLREKNYKSSKLAVKVHREKAFDFIREYIINRPNKILINYKIAKYNDKVIFGYYGFNNVYNSIDELLDEVKSVPPLNYELLHYKYGRRLLRDLDIELLSPAEVETLVKKSNDSSLLEEIYRKHKPYANSVFANPSCPKHLIEELMEEPIIPQDFRIVNLLENKNLDYEVVIKLSEALLINFHSHYWDKFFKTYAEMIPWELHKRKRELEESGRVYKYNCPKCSKDNVEKNVFNYYSFIVWGIDKNDVLSLCPICNQDMVEFKEECYETTKSF